MDPVDTCNRLTNIRAPVTLVWPPLIYSNTAFTLIEQSCINRGGGDTHGMGKGGGLEAGGLAW